MDFIRSLSRGSLAFLFIGGAILLLMFMDPPHTLCNIQINGFKNSQLGFLTYDSKKNRGSRKSGYDFFYNYCKLGQFKQGSCFPFFNGMRKMLDEMKTVSHQCEKTLYSDAQIEKAIWGSLRLFIEMAWGEQPPENTLEKSGWLDYSSLGIYCRLKTVAQSSKGLAYWGQWAKKTLIDLPGGSSMDFQTSWSRSLFALNCQGYL